MQTIILGHNGASAGPSNSAARYACLEGSGSGVAAWSSSVNAGRNPWSIAGTLSNLKVRFPNATSITNGGTFIVTIRNQSGPTSVTCTVTSASILAEDITHTLAVSVGDVIEVDVSPSGTPDVTAAQVQISCVFDATTSGETFLWFGNASNASNSVTGYSGLGSGATWNATEATRSVVMPCAGTIDTLHLIATGAPGAGTSYTGTVRLNGVDQTLTTAVTDTNTTATPDTTHSFSVVAGDIVSVSCVPAGTPTARAIKGCVRFVPTVSGSTPIMANNGVPSTAATRYLNTIGTCTNISTEGSVVAQIPAACDLKNMYIDFDSSPGASKSRAFISRINTGGGAADGTVTATVSNTGTTANDTTHTDSLTAGTLIDVSTTPSGTPGSPGNMRSSFVLYVAPSGGGYVYTPDLRSYFY